MSPDFYSIFVPIMTLVGAIVGGLITQSFRRKNQYQDPYTKWCIDAFGTIHEFDELCHKIRKNHSEIESPSSFDFISLNSSKNEHLKDHLNSIYIISHLWEMHREAEKGYKWLGQIKKQNPGSGVAFNKLFDDVDNLWHLIEIKNVNFLAPQTNLDNIRKILRKIEIKDRQEIAFMIINRINENEFACVNEKEGYDVKSDAIWVVINFLFQNIPRPWYKFNSKLKSSPQLQPCKEDKIMHIETEIAKEEKLKTRRSKVITIGSLAYLGFAIIFSLFFKLDNPLMVQVLIPLTIGVSTGLLLSIISISQNYHSTVRLIELKYSLEEIKKITSKDKQMDITEKQ